VLSDRIEGGRAGARVALSSVGLTATTAEGQVFSLPFAACKLERGGASGNMWFCRAADGSLTVFSEARGFAAALGEAGRRELGDQLLRIEEGSRRRARRSLLLAAGIVLALGLVAWAGLIGIRALGRASVLGLPVSFDEKLGELVFENMDLQGPKVQDPRITQAVDRLAKPLLAQVPSPFSIDLVVVEASIVNAFALPGGPIVVYTGLLESAQSPAQVQAVLAHELAHVTRRHGIERIGQSVGVVAAVQLLFGDVSGLMAVAVEILREGALSSYSRGQEHEADMDAVRTLARAQIDPEALAAFFTLLLEREAKLPSVVGWLSSHPDTQQRVREVRRAAADLGEIQTKPSGVDWQALQQRVKDL
jgi:predicted Zn-dependent protease